MGLSLIQCPIFVSPMGLSFMHCPNYPGFTFESVFHSLVLGLYGPYGYEVVNVEKPACKYDYILWFILLQKKETWPSGRMVHCGCYYHCVL